jgi:uncharacterized membrane protein
MDVYKFILTMVIMAIVDAPWLWITANVIRDPFYSSSGKPRLWAAGIVYIGLAYLLLQQTSATNAFFVGMATYAVYDFTVLAVRGEFRTSSAILDTIWGGILFYLTYSIIDKL